MHAAVRSALLRSTILAIPLLGLTAAPSSAQQRPAPGSDIIKNVKPVPESELLKPPPGDWLMWRRTYNAWGYSPLEQINKGNVKNLQVAWTWALNNGATEMTPIVRDGVLYITNAGDKVQAINGATGDLIWEYRRDLPQKLVTEGGNTLAKRNMAILDDELIIATSDAHLAALDLKTGKVIWDHTTADWTKGWRYSGGPFVAGGVIVQGMTGCGNAEPGGCFITGNDPKTGEEKWRVYTVARPGEPGGDTWNGLPLESRFGASAWISGSYDPDTKTVFYGAGQPYPWIAEMRGTLPQKDGQKNNALFSDTTMALDPATGKMKWYFQHLQNDTYDLDYVYERVLVDLKVNGQTRKAVVTAGKIGMLEALDRTNGQFLWSQATIPQNVIQSVDPKTGEKTLNQAAIPHIGQTTVNCPADPGGRGWPATAYSPKTQMLYMPLNEYCSNTTPTPLDAGQSYTGGGRAVYSRVPVPNSDGNIGRIDAIKLDGHSTAWSHRQRSPATSAVLPTAGGVVFSGSWDRYFRALDDATGKILWEVRTSNAVNAFPVSYTAGGKQYVAVAVGNGSSQMRSLATLTPEIANPDGGSSLWVFALPDAKK